MKKFKIISVFLVVVFCLSLATSCAGSGQVENQTIEEMLDAIYDSDFDYTKVEYQENDNSPEQTEVILAGEYSHDPYEEHIKVISSPYLDNSMGDNNLNITEFRYSSVAGIVIAEILTGDGWVEQQLPQRPALFPTGENIEYQFIEQTELEGNIVEVYSGTYSENIAERFGYEEEIKAIITQKYYVDKSKKRVVKIESELSDHAQKISIANYMASSDLNYSEAQEAYPGNIKNIKYIQEITIKY